MVFLSSISPRASIVSRRVGGTAVSNTSSDFVPLRAYGPNHTFSTIMVSSMQSSRLQGVRVRSSSVQGSEATLNSAPITIQGRKMDVTDAMKEFIMEKVTKSLSNYEAVLREVDVTVSVAGNHGKKSSEAHHQRSQKVEITVYTKRHCVVRVEDTEDDLYAAVDLVVDKLKRKMVKMKEKSVQKNTWQGRGGTKGGVKIDQVLQSTLGDSTDEEEEYTIDDIMSNGLGDIVREKILILSEAMAPEEAVEQLEAVGHDFFVFVDSKDGSMKIVYKREHHGYGIIIPTV